MALKENLKKIAHWFLIQIDRSIHPLKYETKAERIERHRREDREHEIRMAQLNREQHQYVYYDDRRDRQEQFDDIEARLQEEIGFGPRKGKGRKPKDPWF